MNIPIIVAQWGQIDHTFRRGEEALIIQSNLGDFNAWQKESFIRKSAALEVVFALYDIIINSKVKLGR